jgi:hypothetical protein
MATFAIIVISMAALAWHTTMREPSVTLRQVASLTTLPGPALSVSYLEPRLRAFGNSSSRMPQIDPIEKMSFVYAP